MIDFELWPQVGSEEHGQKKLFVRQSLSSEEGAQLSSKGWVVVDVRTLPKRDDDERRVAVRALLEGIAVGSIEADKLLREFIALEMQDLKMLSQKEAPTTKKNDFGASDIEAIFNDFGSNRAFMGSQYGAKKLGGAPATKDGPKKRKKPQEA